MTCIVGIVDKEKRKVIIGADSMGLAGLDASIRKDRKIFKNKDFLIGCTSSFRMIQLLMFSFNPPEIGSKKIFEYMCTDFVDELRECFKKGGILEKGTGGDERGGRFLIGYKDRLFNIDYDFQVGENINGIESVGCGSPYALGSLLTTSTNPNMTSQEKVLKALEVSAFLSAGVSAPFVIKST